METEKMLQISYVPKILRNMAEICEEMGVGEKTVKAWVKRGAPIAVEGDRRRVRYSAEAATLQCWRYSI
ncbi:MerR family transcriptional regulator [Desulfovibrio sp.]|uniref:MerR family transcriptional regulator n=1 Tax=Desulfovibrio sp. TaxID=885 RepID=UPI0025BC17E2|nr:MerR family transcriptional regulator [Desulfovibrio sp.]